MLQNSRYATDRRYEGIDVPIMFIIKYKQIHFIFKYIKIIIWQMCTREQQIEY